MKKTILFYPYVDMMHNTSCKDWGIIAQPNNLLHRDSEIGSARKWSDGKEEFWVNGDRIKVIDKNGKLLYT